MPRGDVAPGLARWLAETATLPPGRLSVGLLVAVLLSSVAHAQIDANLAKPGNDAPAEQHLFGDWGGLRSDLHSRGVDLSVDYTGQVAADVAGGRKTGVDYAQQIQLKADVDWSVLAGIKGFSTHAILVNRAGRNLGTDYVGDNLFQPQSVYGGAGDVARPPGGGLRRGEAGRRAHRHRRRPPAGRRGLRDLAALLRLPEHRGLRLSAFAAGEGRLHGLSQLDLGRARADRAGRAPLRPGRRLSGPAAIRRTLGLRLGLVGDHRNLLSRGGRLRTGRRSRRACQATTSSASRMTPPTILTSCGTRPAGRSC